MNKQAFILAVISMFVAQGIHAMEQKDPAQPATQMSKAIDDLMLSINKEPVEKQVALLAQVVQALQAGRCTPPTMESIGCSSCTD